MRYVIGIDAGGTKTVGLLAEESGKVLREARGGGANLRVHGELGVEKALFQVIDALDAPAPVDALCLGIAGVAREEERALVRDLLRRLGIRREVRIVNDALVALVAGAPDGHGIVVVAGTGAALRPGRVVLRSGAVAHPGGAARPSGRGGGARG
jgi:N-acetylglucosamine kinase